MKRMEPMTEQQSQKMIAAAFTRSKRDGVLLALASRHASRASELAGLRLESQRQFDIYNAPQGLGKQARSSTVGRSRDASNLPQRPHGWLVVSFREGRSVEHSSGLPHLPALR